MRNENSDLKWKAIGNAAYIIDKEDGVFDGPKFGGPTPRKLAEKLKGVLTIDEIFKEIKEHNQDGENRYIGELGPDTIVAIN